MHFVWRNRPGGSGHRRRPVGPAARRWAAALAAVVLGYPLLAGTGVAAAAPGGSDSNVIVRFAGAPAMVGVTGLTGDAATRVRAFAQVRGRLSALRAAHRALLSQAAAAGVHATVRADLGDLYNGIALRVPTSQVGILSRMAGVTGVYPDTRMRAAGPGSTLTAGPGSAVRTAPDVAPRATVTGAWTAPTSVASDVSGINAPAVWATGDANGNPVIGTGEVIAVVDTGIDYNDPDLGGGFGPGYKVVGGYDFVNNDADPMDDNGHGTHVAGIAAGDAAEPGGRTGVAPGAELTAYKVLSASGYGYTSTIIEGLEAAVDVNNPYRAGVVNLSLSGPGDGSDPLSQAAEAAVAAGVVVVAAAGNSGPGESTVGAPAAAPDVLSVGASVTGIQIPTVTMVAPTSENLNAVRLNLSANPPATPTTMDVVDVGGGQDAGYTGKDVTGKAVLVPYNSFEAGQLVATAQAHGAAAVIFTLPDYYSGGGGGLPFDQPAFATGTVDPTRLGLVAVAVDGPTGTDIRDDLNSGPVTVRIAGTDATDLIPSFSSHGPVLGSYAIKPDLVAPGVEIRSTVPGGYERMSGTSMAAPHVAGAVALLRQAHPDWSAARISAALIGSAHLLAGYDPTVQGAGRLDVLAADRATAVANPPTAPLGVADLSAPVVTATTTVPLANPTGRPLDLTVAAQPAAGQDFAATVTPATVHLAAGGTADVTLTLHGDRPAAAVNAGGWLRATAANGAVLTVPYLLAVRPLLLHADPDPTVSGATIYINAQPDLAAPPTIAVTAPNGHTTSYQATFDHQYWWRVAVTGQQTGVYHVTASAPATPTPSGTGTSTIVGSGAFEVVPVAHGNAPGAWQPVGPDGDGGPIAASPTRPGRVYALTTEYGHAVVYRTDDYGATWQEERAFPVGDGADITLAADPRDPDTVYLGLAGGGLDPTYGGRLLASHDAGLTWTVLPLPDVPVQRITTDPTGQDLIVSSFHGGYLSTDRGEHWSALPLPDTFVLSARMIGTDVYAATTNGLYVVRDAATNPAAGTLVYVPAGWDHTVYDVAGTDPGHLLAMTLWRVVTSHDGGANWQAGFTPPDGAPLYTMRQVGGTTYVAGAQSIWVSSDAGATFTAMPAPAGWGIFEVGGWAHGSWPLVVTVAGQGVYTTTDAGATYQRVGLSSSDVSAVSVAENADNAEVLAAGTLFSDYTTPVPTGTVTAATRDWGLNGWENSFGGNVQAQAVSPADPHVLYRAAGTGFGGFWEIDQSTDGGATWNTEIMPTTSGRATAMVVDAADPNRVYVTYQDGLGAGVLVSADGGATWTAHYLGHAFTAIAADPTDPDRIWLGGPDGLFRSDDGGRTVTRLQPVAVSALAIDPADPAHLVAGGATLYDSTDGGVTLHPATVTDLRMKVTAIVFTATGAVFAGTGAGGDPSGLPVGGRGVLRSGDGGLTWADISAGLPDRDVASLAVTPDGRWLFAGTIGGGVYRFDTTG